MRLARAVPLAAAGRRVAWRTANAVVAATLVTTGLVAVPARSGPAAIVDKVHTLTGGRAEPGFQRTVDLGQPAELMGFEWDGAQPGSVEVRAKGPDGWADWQRADGDPDEGPDPGSHERHDITTAGPVWVGRDVTQVQVRVAGGSLRNLKLHALHAEAPPSGGGIGVTRPAGAAPAQPGIVSRAGWGADESYRAINPGCSQPGYAPNVTFAVVHHTVNANTYTAADASSLVRGIYYFHTHTNKWCDIGYSFLVDRFGTVYEGRYGGISQAVIGAHASGYNVGSTGAAVLGTFTTDPVPSVAYVALRNLLAWKLALHGVDPHGTIAVNGGPVRAISGHGDLNATECPGDMAEALLPALRTDVAASIGLPAGSRYHPLPPARVLDTRSGVGAPGPVGPGGVIDVRVTGVGGVPVSGVTAVALNVTVTNASGPDSFLTVWPKGAARPFASNLNFLPGVSVPNLVTARVGADGSVSMYNHSGTVAVVADVAGWYSDGAAGGSSYLPVYPARILDTRTGTGVGLAAPVGPGGTLQVQATGAGGVPPSGVSAVILNVAVAGATGPESYLTVWPSGTARPLASNLNFTAGPATSNLVVAPVGADGKVAVYNSVGATHVIADVQGWFAGPATSPPGSSYVGISPRRILDTRVGTGTGGAVASLGPGAMIDLVVAGAGGLPATGVTSVALNVTVTGASGPESYLTVFPSGTARPLASNLNFAGGKTVANLVVARVQNGRVAIFNASGSTHVIADVQGWFSGPS